MFLYPFFNIIKKLIDVNSSSSNFLIFVLGTGEGLDFLSFLMFNVLLSIDDFLVFYGSTINV
jgi:hypothetical protein